jgi:hypothetical protein
MGILGNSFADGNNTDTTTMLAALLPVWVLGALMGYLVSLSACKCVDFGGGSRPRG